MNEASLTQAQIATLYTRGLINHATWTNALRQLRSEAVSHLGDHALRACALAIDTLVEIAVNAACAAIQAKLGVKTGDVAATVLSDGTIERELTRYVHVELEMASAGHDDEEPRTVSP